MDGDGHRQASFYLVGHGKHNPSHRLRKGNSPLLPPAPISYGLNNAY